MRTYWSLTWHDRISLDLRPRSIFHYCSYHKLCKLMKNMCQGAMSRVRGMEMSLHATRSTGWTDHGRTIQDGVENPVYI